MQGAYPTYGGWCEKSLLVTNCRASYESRSWHLNEVIQAGLNMRHSTSQRQPSGREAQKVAPKRLSRRFCPSCLSADLLLVITSSSFIKVAIPLPRSRCRRLKLLWSLTPYYPSNGAAWPLVCNLITLPLVPYPDYPRSAADNDENSYSAASKGCLKCSQSAPVEWVRVIDIHPRLHSSLLVSERRQIIPTG